MDCLCPPKDLLEVERSQRERAAATLETALGSERARADEERAERLASRARARRYDVVVLCVPANSWVRVTSVFGVPVRTKVAKCEGDMDTYLQMSPHEVRPLSGMKPRPVSLPAGTSRCRTRRA